MTFSISWFRVCTYFSKAAICSSQAIFSSCITCWAYIRISVGSFKVTMVTSLGDWSHTTSMGMSRGLLISLNLIILYPIGQRFSGLLGYFASVFLIWDPSPCSWVIVKGGFYCRGSAPCVNPSSGTLVLSSVMVLPGAWTDSVCF